MGVILLLMVFLFLVNFVPAPLLILYGILLWAFFMPMTNTSVFSAF